MYATMDIGTNSCRLLVARLKAGAQLEVIERQLRITRIGEGMNPTQRTIKPVALARTITALEEFADLIRRYPVQKVILVATQAVRTADNQAELLGVIRQRLGWEVQIIPGEREAWLSYLGATRELAEANYPLVIDIGGGSTEFIQKVATDKVVACSIPLGALKLLENPLEERELDLLLAEALEDFVKSTDERESQIVGVGGTCTTVAAVSLGLTSYDPLKVQGYRMPIGTIQEVYDRLHVLSEAERLKVPGIYPGREDIIIPGLQLLLGILRYLQQGFLTVSDQDLLYGLIYEQCGSQV